MKSGLTQLLRADHREIEDLCEQLLKMRQNPGFQVSECEKTFMELKGSVVSHTKAEELALYSLFSDTDEKEEKKLKSFSLEGYEEHQIADRLLEEMESIEISDEQWLAKLTVLSELLTRHISEEEKDYLPDVERVLEQEELEDLGALYLQQRREVYKIEVSQTPSTYYEESAFQL